MPRQHHATQSSVRPDNPQELKMYCYIHRLHGRIPGAAVDSISDSTLDAAGASRKSRTIFRAIYKAASGVACGESERHRRQIHHFLGIIWHKQRCHSRRNHLACVVYLSSAWINSCRPWTKPLFCAFGFYHILNLLLGFFVGFLLSALTSALVFSVSSFWNIIQTHAHTVHSCYVVLAIVAYS